MKMMFIQSFFLEELLQLVADVDSGKEKLIPMEDVMKEIKSWNIEDNEKIGD
jgi:hypothetical protein